MPTPLSSCWLAVTLVIVTACGPGERGEVVFPPEGLALDSTGRQDRIFLNDTLIPLRTIGGTSDADTTLLNPYLMAMDGDQIYLVEMDNRVLCYDSLGRLRWVQGKSGGGPGEYRNPRDLKVGADGRIWIVDPSSGRITVLRRSTGKVDTMLPLKVGHTEALIPMRQQFAVFPPEGGADVQYFSHQDVEQGVDSIRWGGFRQMEYLSRQFKAAVDRTSGRWVVAFIYGNGWFAFDTTGGGSGRRFFVEPTAFPPVIKQHRGDQLVTSLVRTPASAIDIQVVHDTVYVLFDGKEPDRRRKVDMYAWSTGKYFGSFRLPERADNIGISGTLVVSYASNPVPRLTFYRRQKKPARQ